MVRLTDKRFGVVHTSPSNLIINAASLEDGKLYFAAGDASGLVKQGIYGVVGITTDGSIDIDGNGSGKQLAMFGTGAVADGTGYGLSQYNFDTDASTKLKNLHDASANYLLKTSYVQVNGDSSGYVPMADDSAGTIDSQTGDWVLTFDGSKVDWYKLPENTFRNDNSIYTGTTPINVNGTIISHADSGVSEGRYGDSSSGRTLGFGDKFKVVDVSVNAHGHVTKAASYELTLPEKPATAGTADVANEAKKTTGTLTIKGNGTLVGTFNGSAAEEVNIISGNTSTLTVTGTTDGSIKITPVTNVINSESNALTTGAQVANYVSTELGKLSGALIYKGVITAYSQLPTASALNTGHVYICSSTFTTTSTQTGVEYRIEVGDMFISNGEKWNIVSSEFDVSTYSNDLIWGTDVSIAVVDGVTIKAKLPENPNTWRDIYVGETPAFTTTVNSGSLKFVNGTNITATWNSTNKTIQFDASGLATNDEVATAKSEAIEAATVYWETL